jgi:lipopolysaccharide transport system permease protein
MAQTSIVKPDLSEIVIRPTRSWAALNLKDLWKYRELVYFLVWRDLKVRYKQTLLGASWAIIQPFLTMVVFTIIFGKLAKLPADNNIPYPIFTYTALLPWGLFSKALLDASRSLVGNSSMITKIYFPRLVLPFASVFSGLVDFGIAFLVLIAIMLYYAYMPGIATPYQISITPAILTLPLFLLLALVTALGIALWLSALNVLYRDVGHGIPFLTQIWLFITPIAYSESLIPLKWQVIYSLNPMAGVVNGFRWALLGLGTFPGPALAISTVISLVILVSGLFYFRRMERTFADLI